MEREPERSRFSRDLIKSKKRVADHGEVFTQAWLVEAMLDLTEESDRIDSRILEPACGNGNFLIRVLQRKLAAVELKSKKSNYYKKYLALIAVMSIYGIELLEDNIVECRKRLLKVFCDYLKIESSSEFYRAALHVLALNLIHGDALKMTTNDGRPIVFSEWEYLDRGRFQRRDFRFDMLTQEHEGNFEKVAPMNVYISMTVGDISNFTTRRVAEVSL